MKRSFQYLCVLMLLALQAFSSNPLIEQAEKAYDARRYKEAIGTYEKLVQDGYKSWQLYFNLGNAYYRDQQLGKAIYYYELARKIEPDDEDVNINLGIAAAKTIDKIDSKENFFIAAVKTGVLTSFTTRTWAWFSIASIFVACLAFYFFLAAPTTLGRRLSFIAACVFGVLFVMTYFLGSTALSARNDNKFAIITSREVRVMNEPTAVAKTKFNLHEGTKIRLVETNGDWVLIKLDNGNEGWLKLSEVGVI